ncbi:MAG: MerR family transcriptional regulator [Erysipelotrichaceae bacterium]|nr:MerR family transcriptional regulator [Erysipelotrichaceae bacterium]
MLIKEVTDQYSITRKALLTYEEKGLIHPKRNLSGYRDYSDEDIITIKKIILLRKMNFSLNEIEEVLHGDVKWREDKMNQLDDQILKLQIQKNYIPNLSLAMIDLYDIDKLTEELENTFVKEKEEKQDSYTRLIDFCCGLFVALIVCIFNLIGTNFMIIMMLLVACFVLDFCISFPPQNYLLKHIKTYIPYMLCILSIIGMTYSLTSFMDESFNCIFICFGMSLFGGLINIKYTSYWLKSYRIIFMCLMLLLCVISLCCFESYISVLFAGWAGCFFAIGYREKNHSY